VLLLHTADLLAKLFAHLAGIVAGSALALGEIGQVASLGTHAVLRLRAGAELVALLVGGVNALAGTGLIHVTASLLHSTALLLALSLALALPPRATPLAAASLPAALCDSERRSG
jgi:hypothetical protein